MNSPNYPKGPDYSHLDWEAMKEDGIDDPQMAEMLGYVKQSNDAVELTPERIEVDRESTEFAGVPAHLIAYEDGGFAITFLHPDREEENGDTFEFEGTKKEAQEFFTYLGNLLQDEELYSQVIERMSSRQLILESRQKNGDTLA